MTGGAVGGPAPMKSRLRCYNCNRLLEFDSGAQYVQCYSCATMNAAASKATESCPSGGRVLSMLCAICQTTNLAPYGVNFVRCGCCNTISTVAHAYGNPAAATAPGGEGSPSAVNPSPSTISRASGASPVGGAGAVSAAAPQAVRDRPAVATSLQVSSAAWPYQEVSVVIDDAQRAAAAHAM